MVTADTITETISTVLNERKLVVVRPEHPTLGAIALEAFGFGKTCDAIVISGDDFSELLATIATRILNARQAVSK